MAMRSKVMSASTSVSFSSLPASSAVYSTPAKWLNDILYPTPILFVSAEKEQFMFPIYDRIARDDLSRNSPTVESAQSTATGTVRTNIPTEPSEADASLLLTMSQNTPYLEPVNLLSMYPNAYARRLAGTVPLPRANSAISMGDYCSRMEPYPKLYPGSSTGTVSSRTSENIRSKNSAERSPFSGENSCASRRKPRSTAGASPHISR